LSVAGCWLLVAAAVEVVAAAWACRGRSFVLFRIVVGFVCAFACQTNSKSNENSYSFYSETQRSLSLMYNSSSSIPTTGNLNVVAVRLKGWFGRSIG